LWLPASSGHDGSASSARKPIVRRLGMDEAIVALWEVSQRETGIAIDVRAAAAA
jgi:hypothetical protein